MDRRTTYSLVVVFIVSIAISMSGIVYAAGESGRRADEIERVNDERANSLCQLIAVFDDSYKQAPPPSETGRIVAAKMHDLRRQLGC